MATSLKLTSAHARAVIAKGQQSAVSTSDIVEYFMPAELYVKIYRGLGSGNKQGPLTLTADEAYQVSFALAAMANTFLDISHDLPKQKAPKQK